MSNHHLVRPSQHLPWDVTVHSVVPPSINKVLKEGGNIVKYASSRDYHAVLDTNGKISVWKGMNVYKLYDPFIKNGGELLSISTNSSSSSSKSTTANSSNDELYVYCLNKKNGYLCLWILRTENERPSMIPKSSSAKLQLPDNAKDISTMNSSGSSLYLGTTTAELWKVTVTVRPLIMHIEELKRTSSTGSGVWNYMFGSSKGLPIQNIFINDDRKYSIGQDGTVEEWRDDESTYLANLAKLLSSSEGSGSNEIKGIDQVHVLQSSFFNSDGEGIDIICKATIQSPNKSNRIYWIRLKLLSEQDEGEETVEIQEAQWLNRFHDNVKCIGLVTTEIGMTYASFEYGTEQGGAAKAVTLVALTSSGNNDNSTNKVHEVDLPIQEIPSVVGIGKDVETHAVILITSTGLHVRARWMEQLQQKATASTTTASASAPIIHADQQERQSFVLANHLRLEFWHYYQTMQSKLPPSWSEATSSSSGGSRKRKNFAEYEAAILATARQLQKEGDSSSSKNPLDWHLAFLKMLHKEGLYKNISGVGRWTLLGIGQELAIHNLIVKSKLIKSSSDDNVPPYGLAAKLEQLQQNLTVQIAPEWTLLLASILKKAEEYKKQHQVDKYDILSNPENLWTHQLKDLLLLELQQQQSSSSMVTSSVDKPAIAQIIESTLQVHQETQSKDYALVKSLGIEMIRSQVKDDILAHKLSVEHAYFEGLCKLHLDHPKNEQFSLESLLLSKEKDDPNFQDFGTFVIDWFTQRNRFDKVLMFGKVLPGDEFGEILNKDERLHKFRWSHALDQKRYDDASDCFYENATDQRLPELQWNLSMSKLAAKLHHYKKKENNDEGRDTAMQDIDDDDDDDETNTRRKRIDKKLDLCKCQMALMENGNELPLQSSETLFKLALEKIENTTLIDYNYTANDDAIVAFSMMGLVISGDNKDCVATVWSKVIEKEMTEKWLPWIRGDMSDDMTTKAVTRDVLLEETLFGKLWAQVQEQPVDLHSTLLYHGDGEILVKKLLLDMAAGRELKRLLKTITSIQPSMILD